MSIVVAFVWPTDRANMQEKKSRKTTVRFCVAQIASHTIATLQLASDVFLRKQYVFAVKVFGS